MKEYIIKRWFLATLYGGLIGFAVMILFIIIGESLGLGDSQFFVGLFIGAGVGYMQGRFLNKFFNYGLKWMWATVGGLGGAFILAELIPALTGLGNWDINNALVGAGLLTGILQYLVIKDQTNNGVLWILFSLIAYTLIMLILWVSKHEESFPWI